MPFRFLPALLGVLFIVSCSSPQPTAPPVHDPNSGIQPTPSLLSLLVSAEDLSVLTTLIESAGLDALLDGDNPLTLFAPTNAAFSAPPAGSLEDLLHPERRDELTFLLSYHIVPGRLTRSDLRNGQTLRTLGGETLRVRTLNGHIQVGGAMLTAPTADARNGIIHGVDRMLTP